IAELLAILAYLLVTSAMTVATLGVGCAFGLLLFVSGFIGILALHIVAILKGVNGGRLLIPGVGEEAQRFYHCRAARHMHSPLVLFRGFGFSWVSWFETRCEAL